MGDMSAVQASNHWLDNQGGTKPVDLGLLTKISTEVTAMYPAVCDVQVVIRSGSARPGALSYLGTRYVRLKVHDRNPKCSDLYSTAKYLELALPRQHSHNNVPTTYDVLERPVI